ncbi:MAG TPA: PaaI family thioesterase [Burkholderiaceae bacterium]
MSKPSTPNADTEQTLQRWRDREGELAARAAPVGLARPDQIAGRTGLQLFQSMLAGEVPRAPITATLRFWLVEASLGHAEFQGTPAFEHYNPLGGVHGGWMATLLDSCVGCAVHTLLPPGKAYTTLELKVNFVKALSDRVPLVRAVGDVIHSGSRVATAEGRLVGPDGTLYAHATTTCLIFDAR